MLLQLGALVFTVIFFVSALGNWLRITSWPPLSIFIDSWCLSQDPLVQELRQAVVQVEIITAEPAAGKRRGTGFNLEPEGLIVTNRHLLENAGSVTVSFPGRGTFAARSWVCSSEADLALISLDGRDLPVVALQSGSPPQPGDVVTVIGNPHNFSRLAALGKVSGFRHLGESRGIALEIAVPIRPGHSGSPVFNESGEVVAVIFASMESGEPPVKKGLAVPVSVLGELLKLQD